MHVTGNIISVIISKNQTVSQTEPKIHTYPLAQYGEKSLRRHGSASLCRVERKNKMAATVQCIKRSNADISHGDEFCTSKET